MGSRQDNRKETFFQSFSNLSYGLGPQTSGLGVRAVFMVSLSVWVCMAGSLAFERRVLLRTPCRARCALSKLLQGNSTAR